MTTQTFEQVLDSTVTLTDNGRDAIIAAHRREVLEARIDEHYIAYGGIDKYKQSLRLGTVYISESERIAQLTAELEVLNNNKETI